MDEPSSGPYIIGIAAGIVKAYVAHNSLPQADLPTLISDVHRALTQSANPAQGEPAAPERAQIEPAEIRRSITPDHLVSFENGKRYKSMKRHLAGRGLTPQQYRQKWALPANYPMMAPNYSAQRSELARSLRLGQKRKGMTKVATEDALRVEAITEAAAQPEGEAAQGDPALAAVIASVKPDADTSARPFRAAEG